MKSPVTLSITEELHKEMHRIPLPKGVKWSDVFQVLMMAALSDKKKETQAEFMKRLLKHERGVEVYNWIRERMRELGEL